MRDAADRERFQAEQALEREKLFVQMTDLNATEVLPSDHKLPNFYNRREKKPPLKPRSELRLHVMKNVVALK